MASKPRKPDSKHPADGQAHDSDNPPAEESTQSTGTATDSGSLSVGVAAAGDDLASPVAGEITLSNLQIDPFFLAASTASGVPYDHVFACRDYGDHYMVVTVDGKKVRGDK